MFSGNQLSFVVYGEQQVPWASLSIWFQACDWVFLASFGSSTNHPTDLKYAPPFPQTGAHTQPCWAISCSDMSRRAIYVAVVASSGVIIVEISDFFSLDSVYYHPNKIGLQMSEKGALWMWSWKAYTFVENVVYGKENELEIMQVGCSWDWKRSFSPRQH